MEFLLHLFALLFDCTNPVVKDTLKEIQLEESIISLRTNVTNIINFFSRLISIKLKSALKLLQQQ